MSRYDSIVCKKITNFNSIEIRKTHRLVDDISDPLQCLCCLHPNVYNDDIFIFYI